MKRILFLLVLFTLLSTYHVYAAEDDSVQENFSVSAVVPPDTSDYQFALNSLNSSSVIAQSTQLAYVITYGANESANLDSTMTIIADWRSSDAASNVPVAEYVLGSATKAYGNTSPIVDLNNRQITWNPSTMPAGTVDQTLKFDLITTSAYTGTNDVPFTVRANMNTQFTTMDELALTKTYRYQAPGTGSTTTDSSTPTTTTTTPPTTSQTPSQPRITDASFTTISDDEATILIDSNTPVTATVTYGTSSRSLSSSLSTVEYSRRHTITLDALLPNTNYYLRVTLTDQQGNTTTSELFTFKTAKKSIAASLEDNIIVLTSGGNILISDTQKTDSIYPIALLTSDSDYEFTYALRKKISLRSIDAVVRSKILGITNEVFAQQPQTLTVPMREKTPSVYVASLKTLKPGFFEVSIRIVDTNGNITEEKIAEIKVISHLTVLEEGTENPIPDSRVYLYFFNTGTKTYEPLAQELFKDIPNPSYTDANGIANITLPEGRYRVNASAFGYDEQTVDFKLGVNPGEDFPQIVLQKNAANIVGYLTYYGNAMTDLVTNVTGVVDNLSVNVRFFNLLATFILTVTVGVTFYFFTIRTRVYLRHLLPYFTHHIKTIAQKHPLGTFCATITDEKGTRLKGALISVLDDTTGELLTSIASNTIGICYLFNPKEHKNLKLLIIKQGYLPKTVAVESDIANTRDGLTIVLKKGQKPANKVLTNTWALTEAIAGRFFEVSLFVSLILELFFLSIYGWGKTLPFFILSLFNLILWILYQKEKQERKIFKKS